MKKYLILFGAVLLLGGCKKYLDVNKNPNSPEASTASANFVFTNAVNAATGYQVGGSHALGSTWSGQLSHSTSFTGGGEEKTYSFNNTNFNYFDGAYDILNDFEFVIKNAQEDGVGHLEGPAKIMQSFIFQKLVDLYGNVPYSEALKGTEFPTPKYDDAQTIYESLITKLDEAITNIKAATFPSVDPSDIVFSGNKTNWLKFANSLKLRILMRQSFMPGRMTYITAEIGKIVAEGSGLMTTGHVTSNPGYTKQPGKLNLFYGTYGYTDQDQETGTYRFRKMNSVIVNWLKASNDLFRLKRICYPKVSTNDTVPGYTKPTIPNPNATGNYVGIPLGPTGNINIYLETLVSSVGSIQVNFRNPENPGSKVLDATRRMIIMTAAEVYFNLAEAAERGVPGIGTAQANYENGVRWAFRLAGGTHTATATATEADADAAANGYLASGVVNADWAASPNKLAAILIQKWTAFCHIDGLEAWSDYRKSGGIACPTSPKSVIAAASPEPVRLDYPLRENQTNGENVPSGIDHFTSKIFWDVN